MPNAREIFNRIINFESCERTLNWEFGCWAGTIERWYKEGLFSINPVTNDANLADDVLGPAPPVSPPGHSESILIDYDVSSFFNFDEGFESVPYDYWIFPRFERKIIFEDDRIVELYNYDGIRKKILKDGTSMPFWIDYPVKNKSDWEKIKEEIFNFNSITKRHTEDISEYSKVVKKGYIL